MEPAINPVDSEVVRLAMRQWATGVTVVTSQYGGVWHGMTASSFTSISLVPPLLLVALEHQTRTIGLVRQSGIFGVTILNDTQQTISDRFAGRQTLVNQFAGLEAFTLSTGAPFLQGGLAFFDCQVVNAYDAGNHTLFVGEVVAAQHSVNGRSPLVYYDRTYWHLQG